MKKKLQRTIEAHWQRTIEEMRAEGLHVLDYLFKLPAAVPVGKILVHNSVRPTRRLGLNGFRAWLAAPNDPVYEVCPCGWAPELGVHYRVAAVWKRIADADTETH